MSVTEQYLKDKQERERRSKLEASNQMQFDGDRSARIFDVAAKTTLPNEIVDADLDNLEAQVKRNEFDFNNYTEQVNGSPIFNQFAAENPYNLSVVGRDRRAMTRMERSIDTIFRPVKRGGEGWDAGWAMTEMVEIRQRHLDFDQREGDAQRLKDLREISEGGQFKESDSIFAKVLVGTGQQLPIQTWLIGESLDEIAIGAGVGAGYGAYMGSVAGGVGALPGAVTGAVVGAGRGFLVGRTEAAFRLESALAYDEYLELGLDEESARWTAYAVGGVNAGLESLGVGALTKRLPGFRAIQSDVVGQLINRKLMKPTMMQAATRAGLRYTEGVATEVVTEIFQEATLMAGREYLKSQERQAGDMRPEFAPMTTDEFWESVGAIAEQTLYSTVLIGAAGPATSFYSDNKRASDAKQLGYALEAMGESAKDSKTREDVPIKYKEFVAALTENGKHDRLLIDVETFETYFQEQGMDPDETAKTLGIENLDEARTSGVYVEMPIAPYLETIAPSEHHANLIPDLKATPDQMTMREAEEFNKNKPDRLKEIEDLAEKVSAEKDASKADAIINDVTGQLVAASVEQGAAHTQAQILRGIPNLARRMGMDEEKLYEDVFGGVRRAQAEALQRRDIDVLIDPLLDMIREGRGPTQKEIFGESLTEMLRARGGLQDEGGELSARDIDKEFRGLIKTSGMSLDAAAEIAAESGFIAERDENLLLEALDRELLGEPVFGYGGDQVLQERAAKMDELAGMIARAGYDLDTMTNAEIRLAFESMEEFDQSDLAELTDLIVALTAERDPTVNAELLGQIAAGMPQIFETQDFGDMVFADTVQVEGGAEQLQITVSAQRKFEQAVKRRNGLRMLKGCVSG